MRLYVLCAMSLAACAFEPTGGPGEPEDPGMPDPGIPADVDAAIVEDPPPPDPPPPAPEPPTLTCRIEGDNLGIVGAKVEADNRTYTFEAWQTNADGAIVGFTLSGPTNNLRFEVRTGDDRHTGDTLVYEGDKRITRVDFCVSLGEGGGD